MYVIIDIRWSLISSSMHSFIYLFNTSFKSQHLKLNLVHSYVRLCLHPTSSHHQIPHLLIHNTSPPRPPPKKKHPISLLPFLPPSFPFLFSPPGRLPISRIQKFTYDELELHAPLPLISLSLSLYIDSLIFSFPDIYS